MSSRNALLRSSASGLLNEHSMLHRRTITLGRGFVIFGGLRVYWYASVSIATFGNSGWMSFATAFTNRRSDPAGLPSALSIAAHLAHWQLPIQSFCETEAIVAL